MSTVNQPRISEGKGFEVNRNNLLQNVFGLMRGKFGRILLAAAAATGLVATKGPQIGETATNAITMMRGSDNPVDWQNNPNIKPPESAPWQSHANYQDSQEQESRRFDNSLNELHDSSLAEPRRLNAYLYMAVAMAHDKVEGFSEEEMQGAKTMAIEVFEASRINYPDYTTKFIDNYIKNASKENDKYRQYTDFIR